jgi:putative DNA primase/helicase
LIAATADQWDTDPWLLNTPGGAVDLHTGEIHPHQPKDYMSKITSVTPGGKCPKWHEFLRQVTNGDQGLMAFLQRMIGYSLTGSTKEQALFFMYGTGGNGKGTFLNTMTAILGDYTATANMDAFTASKNPQHTTELAMLRGARIVTAQETEEGKKWAESRIKALTGGDPITARFMRQDNFTFTPQFKLIIAGNHKPSLRSVDDAIRRRFNLLPFTFTIPRDKRDKDLQERFKSEYPGILQWAIEGTKMWLEKGLAAPPAVQAATDEYMTEEDAFGRWASERYMADANAGVTLVDLFNDWQGWCSRCGEFAGTSKSFNATFKNRNKALEGWQCPTTRRGGVRGIRLRNAAEDVFGPADADIDPMS